MGEYKIGSHSKQSVTSLAIRKRRRDIHKVYLFMLDTGRIYAQSRIDILLGQLDIRGRLKNFSGAAKRRKRRKPFSSSSAPKATAVAFNLGHRKLGAWPRIRM